MKSLVVTSAALGVSLMLVGEFLLPDGATPVQTAAVHDAEVVVTANADPNEIVQGTCVRCHSDSRLRGNLSLEDFDIGSAEENAEVIERMIRKVRAGMMPPPGVRAPEGDTLQQFAQDLEDTMAPRWMMVITDWRGRGGIRSTIRVEVGRMPGSAPIDHGYMDDDEDFDAPQGNRPPGF